MKKIFLLLLISFSVVAGFTQNDLFTGNAKEVKNGQPEKAAAWACPACFTITKEGGQCAKDKTEKIQLDTYYCQHCVKATGNNPGNCNVCHGATTQMTRKLCAQYKEPVKKTT